MTTFIDGPAEGQVLMLKRSPRFLRVTQNGPNFDALDQLDDEPEETEIIYVYQIEGGRTGHVNTAKGTYPIARYRQVQPQPIDNQVRETQFWRLWTELQNQQSKIINQQS